jgi:hypothetical protein
LTRQRRKRKSLFDKKKNEEKEKTDGEKGRAGGREYSLQPCRAETVFLSFAGTEFHYTNA